MGQVLCNFALNWPFALQFSVCLEHWGGWKKPWDFLYVWSVSQRGGGCSLWWNWNADFVALMEKAPACSSNRKKSSKILGVESTPEIIRCSLFLAIYVSSGSVASLCEFIHWQGRGWCSQNSASHSSVARFNEKPHISWTTGVDLAKDFNSCLFLHLISIWHVIDTRTLYAGQETIVRTGHVTMDWSKIGKGVCQGCILSSCLFNFYAEYIMWNVRLDESQADIKISGRNINNLRNADDTSLMTESKEELKSLLMRVKEESEKAVLKLNIKKTKVMTSSPIISCK